MDKNTPDHTDREDAANDDVERPENAVSGSENGVAEAEAEASIAALVEAGREAEAEEVVIAEAELAAEIEEPEEEAPAPAVAKAKPAKKVKTPARKLAVLGSPIGHSKSPLLHRAAYRALGLDWVYDTADVSEETLADFLAGLGPEWRGLSLTMPLKQSVMPLLDEADHLAEQTGGANTVLLDDGAVRGFNTDVSG